MKRHRGIRQVDLFPVERRKVSGLSTIGEHILLHRVPVPLEEYAFASHIGRAWRFDYAWPDFRVAYEREGATWGRVITGADGKQHRLAGGRHMRGDGADKDASKYNAASTMGWLLIRGTASTERNGQAIKDLVTALRARGWKGHP